MPKEFDLNKYKKMFVSESREHLRSLNESMVQLESRPDDKELVDKMFRACHTIKGMAGMMSYHPVTETAHALEDVLSAVRTDRLKPTGKVADCIFKSLDALESMVNSAENTDATSEVPGVVELLRSVVATAPEKTAEKKKEETVPVAQPAKTSTVFVKLGRRCSLPSARALVIIKEIEKTSHVLGMSPTEDEIEAETVFEELAIQIEPGDRLQDSLKRIVGMSDVEVLMYGASDQPKEKWTRISKPEVAASVIASEGGMVQTVKVGMDKLDDLLDDVGELVISRSRLLEKATADDDADLQEISSLIDKLTSDIQSKVLSIRMIPLELVTSRFPRMIRDMSKSQGKEVEFIVEGGNIELDRTVMDRISDPLMHIIRNCIDHGIEPPEERQKAGKHPKGMIRVVASKQQDHVLIEVTDDGKGIDIEKVRRAAVSKGIFTKEQTDVALARDLMDLLFRPGFSTKTDVTETSGRGVGLDVVKKGVETLGGSVMINTTKGVSTTISLWLPFTLAIIDAMLVSVRSQIYAVPMSVVVESHGYDEEEVKLIRNREVVQLRGEVLPLIRMREFFGIEDKEKKAGAMNAVIVQSRDRRAALEVDELLGHQQIVVKSLDQRLRRTKGISGGTILGSGGIALILDVESILGG
jgi:two-component system chemotaxis sensor kinase CheA